ncbi:hypothetical protein F4810DRAFT_707974 [Camillea tinctor]|nr:hypothetical protein F4810DRAFT_707974 [Camillea tinctor]
MHLLRAVLFSVLAAAANAKPTVYFIRHGEKEPDSNDLSTAGEQRAQCLRDVFGANSQYNITHIMAQTPKATITELKDGKRQRPYLTVKPLAADLGLEVDISCGRDDEDCVADVVNNYEGDGNILICWEHNALKDIAEELGAKHVDDYPSDNFNLIWTDPYDYTEIASITSENCPGLDG